VTLWVLGAAAAQGLPTPCPDVDPDVSADDAVRALTDDELVFAREVATEALDQLDCVPRVVDPEDLATLYQTRAGAAFYADPQQPFAADLAASAGVYPGWFNDRLGPDLRQAWEEASAGISGTASLSVWPIPDDGVLYVDGAAQDAQPLATSPGPHLVQVAVGADVLWAWAGSLAPSAELTLETGLPEPTKARLVRDNPLLWSGLAAGVLVGAGWFPARAWGQERFNVTGGWTFYDDPSEYPDPVASLDADFQKFRMMKGGLAAGGAVATALLTSHLVLKLRARGSG